MMPTLTALLCLGLSLGPRTRGQARILPKPRLWAQPGSVIPRWGTVDLWCAWSLGAQKCHLLKEGSSPPWKTQMLEMPMNTAKFSIRSMTAYHAGRYHCNYQNAAGSSEPSDALELVVTGVYNKPSLSAEPSPVVTSGGNVTLLCGSQMRFNRFILTEEWGSRLSRTQDSQPGPEEHVQALFHVGPVTSSHRWTFRCYGYFRRQPQVWSEPSDALELLVPGTLPKASFFAEPSSVIPQGKPVALRCEGTLEAQEYYLDKEGWTVNWDRQTSPASRNKAKFSIPSVTKQHAGQYRCYYHSPAGWSQPSKLLELVVTGVYSKPSLSALPSPVVTSGGNITLQCGSQRGFDRFILTKEGGNKQSWMLDTQYNRGNFQALFTVGPLTATPSLSVHPIPPVSSGENVTLLCQSQNPMDTFLLSKEGAADPPLRLRSESQAQQSQAEFSLGAASSSFRGTYRCYGSQNSTPYLLSQPSDAVELEVSECSPTAGASWARFQSPVSRLPGDSQSITVLVPVSAPLDSRHREGLAWHLKALIGVLVASVLLLLLLVLFLVLRHQRQSKSRTAGE
ncbi:leukocyte immunoglobulin-like receptor subfamily A member 6 [Octodon degus]|uniref:Leukocyte immunoglobulin-like receptor subfamily A member 6 n=1 Tax=Octodon degus TaxID=10160 RepID=A0A6P6DWZ6_OCTDE|nr:leukocyte immunoglobulin-like receptor subfamily A member 6 [Octodon degus]